MIDQCYELFDIWAKLLFSLVKTKEFRKKKSSYQVFELIFWKILFKWKIVKEKTS